LNDSREIEDLGLDEIAADGVLAIEWGEKLGEVPDGAIGIRITDAEGDMRAIELTNYSDR
jgi:tRNA A37 threonylcarbamoyladenosine biosynthesis protein TsaE